MVRGDAIRFLRDKPVKFAHMAGFTLLGDIHNEWIRDMVFGREDDTLQAHRGSYKTTCVSVALALSVILFPNKRNLFLRKTNADVKEIIAQTAKILQSPYTQYFVQTIYGQALSFEKLTENEIMTNLTSDIRGTSQLVGQGIDASLTGKHYDNIFTDDIVNVEDRTSVLARNRTKTVYQELQNIKNRGGRIFNIGTPWHKDDAFLLMPPARKFDCYMTGLITSEELDGIREKMTASLFAANYELRHIAAEDVIFSPKTAEADILLCEQGECHVDAAYDGADFTAFTVCRKKDGIYYVFGKLWRRHVEECEEDIVRIRQELNAGRIHCEDNGDKGYLAKSLRKRGERVSSYHEGMNKFLKITSHLKGAWRNVVFVKGTDAEYIRQICDYNENAEHDDAPDSLASVVRWFENHAADDEKTGFNPYL